VLLPTFLKRSCRICNFSGTDADLIQHIDTDHPSSRFWKDPKACEEKAEATAETDSVASLKAAKIHRVDKEVVEGILRSQVHFPPKYFLSQFFYIFTFDCGMFM
jgi:hypothetical protein